MKPLLSTKKQLSSALSRANSKLKKTLSKKDYSFAKNISSLFDRQKDSLSYFRNNESRTKQYTSIVNSVVNKYGTVDKKDPDLYIFGGVPASGKTSLRSKVPEKTVLIDSDYFKEKLAKGYPSPSKKYKLIHASLLHREADILVEKALNKAAREKRDITLDITAGSKGKIIEYAHRFKAKGYDIHFLGILQYPHVAIGKAVGRFLAKGRYVPPSYIANKGNQINKNIVEMKKDTGHLFNTTYVTKAK